MKIEVVLQFFLKFNLAWYKSTSLHVVLPTRNTLAIDLL